MFVKLIEKHKGLRRNKTYFAVPKDALEWCVTDHQNHLVSVPREKLVLILELDRFPISAYDDIVFETLQAAHERGYEVQYLHDDLLIQAGENHVFDASLVYTSTGNRTERAKYKDNKAILLRIKELKNQIATLEGKIN